MGETAWHQRANEIQMKVQDFIGGEAADGVGDSVKKYSARDGQYSTSLGRVITEPSTRPWQTPVKPLMTSAGRACLITNERPCS